MDPMNLAWDWPGSRWWRVDLHAHSPASGDFRRDDPEHADWSRWVRAAAHAALDAIAITDHNTASGISAIQRAAEDVPNAPILFPGVELTVGGGVHLLILLDPASGEQHVDDLLSRAGVPVEDRGSEVARSSHSAQQILVRLGEEAVILGPHANGPKGVLSELRGLERLAVFRHPHLAGVEVDPDSDLDERWLDGSMPEIGRSVSRVWGSDAHSRDELGWRFTWVKMSRPDLDGLRLALLDGEGSLKPVARDHAGDPNAERGELLIESMEVSAAKFMGRTKPLSVRFNPWLNAIIGGRGTGKSTLVDFCRKTLRRAADLDASGDRGEDGSLRQRFERRVRVPAGREEGLLTEDSRIEVVYRKHGERFALSWSEQARDPAITRLVDGNRTPEEGSVYERFPARVYSQKQLFALAQDPDALLVIIDDSSDVRAAEKRREIEHLESRYLALRAQARAAASRAGALGGLRAQLGDVRRKLDFLQRGGQAEQLRDYRNRRQLEDTWGAVTAAARDAVRSVAAAAEQLEVAELDGARRDTADDPSRSGLARAHQALGHTVSNLRKKVLANVEDAQLAIEAILEGEDLRAWRQALAESEDGFRDATTELRERGIRDPGEYTDLLAAAARLGREIETLEKEQRRAQRFSSDAADVLARCRRRRQALGQARAEFAVRASGGTIRVEVVPFANIDGLRQALIEILGTEHFEADRSALARRIRASSTEWDWESLDDLVGDIRRFVSGQIDAWPTQDRRFEGALRRVRPERIDRLALYSPDDRVSVSFRAQGRGWKPLKHGSPGQQTAALLAFVLGHGSEPIILDQPEDDLDNTLIYDLLVTQLREAKLRRQVIVVTHNPNIVVHGDAELVLSLEAAAGQTRIACEGGLQETKVREEICRVMEGGREAFESRYRRIMPSGRSAS